MSKRTKTRQPADRIAKAARLVKGGLSIEEAARRAAVSEAQLRRALGTGRRLSLEGFKTQEGEQTGEASARKSGQARHNQLEKENTMTGRSIRLEEIRELQAELHRSRLVKTREYLARRYYNVSADGIDAAARLLVASDHAGQAAVRLSEAGEITLTDSERAEAVTTLLKGCQEAAGRGFARFPTRLTEDEAKVKRLTDQGMSEADAWTKLANEGEVQF